MLFSPKTYWTTLERVGADLCEQTLAVSSTIAEAYRTDAVTYICGNGGSASTASHFACDLAWGTRQEGRAALRAISLADQHALLSALENDTLHERAFAWLVRCYGRPGDVFVGISASGDSANVVEAARAASEIGMRTVALVGFDGGELRSAVDRYIHAPIHDYGVVEDLHLMLCHVISYGVRDLLDADERAPEAVPALGRSAS